MSHKEAFVLLHEYAVGALSNEERRLVDSHLATGCPRCQDELRDINDALVLLAEADGLIDPPERLKESVLSRVLDEPQEAPVGVVREGEQSPATRRRLHRIAAGLAIAASLAFAAFGVPWLAGLPGPASEDDATASIPGVRGLEVRYVSLSAPAAERTWLKHVLYDSLSGELHVWVTGRVADTEAVPTHVELIDPAGASVATVPLDAGNGFAGAVIAAPNLPTAGTLVLRSGPSDADRGKLLESCDYELR